MYIANKWTKSGDVFVMADGTEATRDEMQGFLQNLLAAKESNDTSYVDAKENYDKYIADWQLLIGDA